MVEGGCGALLDPENFPSGEDNQVPYVLTSNLGTLGTACKKAKIPTFQTTYDDR